MHPDPIDLAVRCLFGSSRRPRRRVELRFSSSPGIIVDVGQATHGRGLTKPSHHTRDWPSPSHQGAQGAAIATCSRRHGLTVNCGSLLMVAPAAHLCTHGAASATCSRPHGLTGNRGNSARETVAWRGKGPDGEQLWLSMYGDQNFRDS